MPVLPRLILGCLVLAMPVAPAQAAALDGAGMSLWWGVPFLGILLGIATGPVFYHHFWEQHYGKIAAGWSIALLAALLAYFPADAVAGALAHALLEEYLPFIALLFGLYTVSGGILVRGNIHGSASTNTAILALGAFLASFVGTTGASMILIRPILRANDNRRHNIHVVVFFIFLVSNVGGALTPLGDPPLFVGFLKGVDFFWTTVHLLKPTLLVSGLLLTIFFVLDSYYYRKEGIIRPDRTPDSRISIAGAGNIAFIGVIIGAVLLRANWNPGISLPVAGVALKLQDMIANALMLAAAGGALLIGDPDIRRENGFDWEPIREVAKLFAGIFICIVPFLAILAAGKAGAAAPLLALVTTAQGTPDNLMYFWLTGILSSFLDNAPTYLVFFELAGGDARQLMGPLAGTLMAISLGAVLMGANTYIGNAPNFMVYAIARRQGVAMPSFFGYLGWSMVVLTPIFVLCSWLFFT